MKTPQTNDSLAKAIVYLGAVEVAPGRYAFSDGFTGCGDGKQWLFVSAEGLSCVPRRGYHAWRSQWTKPAPAWWTPDARFAWRDKRDGTILPNDGLSPSADSLAAIHPEHYERITADLNTGEEVPA